jgi:hypothetical protein
VWPSRLLTAFGFSPAASKSVALVKTQLDAGLRIATPLIDANQCTSGHNERSINSD